MTVSGGIPADFKPIAEWLRWFHPKQIEFIDALGDYYEIGYIGGNGSGKTRILYWSVVTLALGCHKYGPKPPVKIKVLVTDFEHGLEEVASDALHRPCHMPDGTEIGPMMPASMIKEYPRKEDRTLKLKNGSIIFFMTSEQKKRLHSGQNIDILACDEEADEGAYDESKRGLRNAKGGGRILHALTPPYLEGQGPSWSKFKILDPWEEGISPRTYIITACMADNPAVTKTFIEEFKKGKTDEQWMTQYYGKYPTWGTVVHPFEDVMWDTKTKKGHLLPFSWQPPYDPELGRYEMGIDWHQSKPTACTWSYTDSDGNVTFFDEISPQEAKDKSISELCEMMKAREEGLPSGRRIIRWADPKMHDKTKIFDGKGFSAWQEFSNCGIRLTEGYNRMPEVGISIVNDFLRGDCKQHPRMFVRENCTHLRRSLKNHYWQQRGDDRVPDEKFKDYCMTVRYILQNKSKKARQFGTARRRWGFTSYEGLPGYRDVYSFGLARRRR